MDVKTLCLGVLTRGDMTGYDIKKHFEELFSHFFVAGFGSIYPALAKLTEQGKVVCSDVAQEGRPDKKVYRITETGLAEFRETLATTAPRHKVRSEFLVLVCFAEFLGAARLAEIVEERIADIERQLAEIDEAECCPDLPAGLHVVADLGRATLSAQLAYLRDNRERIVASLAAPSASAA